MNDNKLLCSLVLAPAALILLLIFFSSTVSAATASGPSLAITTAKIPNTEFSNGYAIYGNYIVWADKRNGQDKPDIYMYDISTHKETRITTSGSVSYPAIYKNRIVWLDNRNGNDSDSNYEDYDIYMYDISFIYYLNNINMWLCFNLSNLNVIFT
jgi:beta propeller repeat protein